MAAPTKVTLGGRVSVTTTSEASSGPLFVRAQRTPCRWTAPGSGIGEGSLGSPPDGAANQVRETKGRVGGWSGRAQPRHFDDADRSSPVELPVHGNLVDRGFPLQGLPERRRGPRPGTTPSGNDQRGARRRCARVRGKLAQSPLPGGAGQFEISNALGSPNRDGVARSAVAPGRHSSASISGRTNIADSISRCQPK